MFAVYFAGVLREIHFDTSHNVGETCDVQLYTLCIHYPPLVIFVSFHCCIIKTVNV